MNEETARWRKSSYSGQEGGSCVEAARLSPTVVGLRDSKDPYGPRLPLGRTAFRSLIEQVKAGDPALLASRSRRSR